MTPEEYQRINAAFFEPLADALNAFAAAHNLRLEHYPNDWPSWKFIFRHPNGGVAAIDVMRTDDDSIAVHSNWWIDDFKTYRRKLHPEQVTTNDLSAQNLGSHLEEAFRSLLSWRINELYEADYDYEPLWRPYPDLASYDEQYPRPTT